MQRIRKAKSTAVLRAFPILFFLVLIITGFSASAQQNFYDTDLLPASFHESRRAELRKKLQPNSIAFVFANPVRNRTNDVDYQYIFDPDLYYLTGLMEPNAVLMVSNTNFMVGGKETNEALFIMGRDSAAEVWTGRQLDITEAGQKLGLKMVLSNTEFSNSIPDLNSFDKVMAKFPTDIRESKSMKAKLGGLVWSLKQKAESQKVEISSAVLLKQLASLREIKSKQE
ncbi:MAG: aminopeptidase P N-terminal domain-containing protein, partial [Bacteroidota bacterium]